MYYLNPSKGNNSHGIFCWKRSEMKNEWTPYNKYGEQVYWPNIVDDKMVGSWLNNNTDANLSYTVQFEKKEVWPKVLENSSVVALYHGADVKPAKVYNKSRQTVINGGAYIYSEWKGLATELTGEMRERWLRFFA